MTDPEWLTITQAASLCGVSRTTMRRWLHLHNTPVLLLPSGRKLVQHDQLKTFLAHLPPR